LRRDTAVTAAPAGFRSEGERDAYVARLDREMKDAAANLDFERAAVLRDEIRRLRRRGLGFDEAEGGTR